ncbi:hypothetical protein XENOCAPTIV_008270 [Xenoophorus captivus]|uniref:Uncharacterized protein n=1 Tax=Xenoophorus captivus TaxID=1517983 RepID=A0ABV0QRE3_9TELE
MTYRSDECNLAVQTQVAFEKIGSAVSHGYMRVRSSRVPAAATGERPGSWCVTALGMRRHLVCVRPIQTAVSTSQSLVIMEPGRWYARLRGDCGPMIGDANKGLCLCYEVCSASDMVRALAARMLSGQVYEQLQIRCLWSGVYCYDPVRSLGFFFFQWFGNGPAAGGAGWPNCCYC